jgi:IS605 OrfB family transposase
VTRTIRCKLSVREEDISTLNTLFGLYAKACSEIALWGKDHRENNAIRLHHALYRTIRQKYGLPANLVVTALRRVAGTLKTANFRGKFQFRPVFVGLDERTFTLKGETVSFSTHTGRRIKTTLDIGDYQREALTPDPTSATLIKARNGFYCNIVVKYEVPDAAGGGVLGVDLGIRNIAVTSTGRKFFGKAIREYRERRWKIRASFQSNGSRGAKKALRHLSGKEARAMSHWNHEIAKAIVAEAVKNGCSTIAFEDLKGIRDRLRVPNKHLNRMVSLWAFAQLQAFVKYKAAMKGIRIVEVNPAYTSQICHVCGEGGLRDRETFTCTTHGEFDADINAAKNIAVRGAGAGEKTADRNAARIADQIVEFFSHTG